jgi:F-type H+-transporting ATPase subunit gamma
MPSLKAVQVRIASVKSTQKITRAMKLVAAAKLRRAQDAIVAARPYSNALSEAVAQVAARAGDDSHPLLTPRTSLKDGGRVTLITVTSDRGLCGGFNGNVFRAAQRFADERRRGHEAVDINLEVVGRKGREYYRRRKANVAHEFAGATAGTVIDLAHEVAVTVSSDFVENRTDAVYLVYNEFKSAIVQGVCVDQLLPITPAAPAGDLDHSDFLYEPGKAEILDWIVPLYVESKLHRAFLESISSELGARMTAMESATKNAKEMIERLTLMYNRARQASITKELMEIVGGAEALRG